MQISYGNKRLIDVIINNSEKQFMMSTLLSVISMAISLHRVSIFFSLHDNDNEFKIFG